MNTDAVLLELVNAVKELSPQLWAIILKQVQVEMYQGIFWSVLCLLILGIGLPLSFKWYKLYDEVWIENDGHFFAAIVIWVVAVVCGIALPFLISNLFTLIMNPEFKAIQYLLSQIQ